MKIADQIADATYTAIIHAPIDKIDLPEWAFSLSEAEYQGCSPGHVSGGRTFGRDGRRMCLHVEAIGESPLVHHYQEELSMPDHLVLGSFSHIFSAVGRLVFYVRWELEVREMDEYRCELSSRITWHATDAMIHGLGRQGISFEDFHTQHQPNFISHHRAETPLFAASIEREAIVASIVRLVAG